MRCHYKKVVKQESEEDARYTMTWKNSRCTENHHYVIEGKLSATVEFTSQIYPTNPGIIMKSLEVIVSIIT